MKNREVKAIKEAVIEALNRNKHRVDDITKNKIALLNLEVNTLTKNDQINKENAKRVQEIFKLARIINQDFKKFPQEEVKAEAKRIRLYERLIKAQNKKIKEQEKKCERTKAGKTYSDLLSELEDSEQDKKEPPKIENSNMNVS